MSIIQSISLYKEYFNGKISVEALSNINLSIKKGEFTVLAGPSGSGKTTLLNMFGCMDKPTKGNLIIDGKNSETFTKNDSSNFRREKIGFIFQAYNLIPVLSAYENIEFSLNLLNKFSKEEKKKNNWNNGRGRNITV